MESRAAAIRADGHVSIGALFQPFIGAQAKS
jgi:hypothetical protein